MFANCFKFHTLVDGFVIVLPLKPRSCGFEIRAPQVLNKLRENKSSFQTDAMHGLQIRGKGLSNARSNILELKVKCLKADSRNKPL